ncbi:CobW family GTP-binding protein [Rhodoplanes azumiensis]|uniref:CobW family GTP-binding protein n=1 Tax=Rhodoplanes azumiensis TaxID=1897628 RepID=A0ABW5AL47_9BRAD
MSSGPVPVHDRSDPMPNPIPNPIPNPSREPNSMLPVHVLTGFLGSGKTTLLARLLADPGMGHTAVLINELGEVGIDHLLVRRLEDDVVLLESGCLCCAVRNELVETLADLAARRAEGDLPAFRRIVVETTGLADPAPIVHTLMTDARLTPHLRLAGLVATVDATLGEGTLATHPEALKQAAMADRLVTTKTDLADAATRDRLAARLAALNPGARRFEASLAVAPSPADLFEGETFSIGVGAGADVAAWLAAEAAHDPPHDHRRDDHRRDDRRRADQAHADHADGDHAHGDGDHGDHAHGEHDHGEHDHGEHDHAGHHLHHHDPQRHGDRVATFCLIADAPLDWDVLTRWLELLLTARGEQILRLKGIVNVRGRDKPVVVHGVQHVLYPPQELAAWPDADRASKLVFITRDLSRGAVERSFERVVAAGAG